MIGKNRQGITLLISGILLLSAVLARLIFDSISTGNLARYESFLFIIVGIYNTVTGYRILKK